MPLDLVLYQPEIPGNTGNIIRLCANTGARLHLIRPLGFTLDDARLRRAGLDYHEWAPTQVYDGYADYLARARPNRVFACSARASRWYVEVAFAADDALLLGPETRGLPQALLEALPEEQRLRIPMRPGQRSLNLANAAAVLVFEAWRQLGFTGAQ